jgi:hypothetical protein
MSTHVVAATRGWIVRITSRGKKSGTTVVGVGVGVGVDGGVGVGIGHGQKAKAQDKGKGNGNGSTSDGQFPSKKKKTEWMEAVME